MTSPAAQRRMTASEYFEMPERPPYSQILSPSTARLDPQTKLPVYREAGVREIWFINLWKHQIEIHRFPADSDAASVITHERKDALTTPLLPDLEIPVAKVLV